MVIKEKSLEEREKAEEEELTANLENLNFFFKEGEFNGFLSSLTNLTKEATQESIATISQDLCSQDLKDFTNEVTSPIAKKFLQTESTMQSILIQNIELYEETLRVMVLGETGCGKTMLISNLLNKGETKTYIPTRSLEIHNKIMKIGGKLVKIELFDTCSKILNDELIKSRDILKIVYFKLSDGFIIISSDEANSLKFAENYVTKIKSILPKKHLLLIKNNKLRKSTHVYAKNFTFDKQFFEKDLSKITFHDKDFTSFFETIFRSKRAPHSKDFFTGKSNFSRYSTGKLDLTKISKFSHNTDGSCKLENKGDCSIL